MQAEWFLPFLELATLRIVLTERIMAYFNNVDMSMEFLNRVFEYFPRWNFVGPCNVQVNVKFDNHLLTRGVKLLLQNTYLRKNNM